MFKVPKSLTSINILGLDVEIELNQALCCNENSYGMFSHNKIILREEYESANDFIKTLVHETMHAHCHIVGLQLDLQVEEVIATTTERLFTTVTYKLQEVLADVIKESKKKQSKKNK